jgi:ABC-type transporter Mla subunit MlaD
VSLFAGSERLQTRLGAVVMLVLLAAIAFVVFLADRIELSRQLRFQVVFAHSGPLHAGAQVVIAGEVIGEVESIALIARGTPGPLAGEPGVAARIRVDADAVWMIDAAGEFFVSSRGPLSERFIEIGPQPCARKPATRPRECKPDSVVPPRPIRAGEQVRGVDPPSMDRVLQRTWENLQITRRFVEEVRPELEQLIAAIDQLRATIEAVQPGPGEWARLFREAGAMIAAARVTWNDVLGGQAGVDDIRHTMASASAVARFARGKLAELDTHWTALATSLERMQHHLATKGDVALTRLGDAIERAQLAMAKLEPLRAKVQDIRDRLARGEGSIGKLMNDPEFPEDAKDLGKILKRQPWKIIGHPPDDLDQGGVAP